MNVSGIVKRLRAGIGLDPDSLGSGSVQGAIANRMRSLGMNDAKEYAALLDESTGEFANLIEEVIVSETWFFRGGELFAFLAGHVRRTIAARKAQTPFRVLSAPCGTGEEPYSLVMALRQAGVASEEWSVDGVDLSTRSLERARQGRYTESSFRETADALRRDYFRRSGSVWELDAEVRRPVRFRQGNLLDPQLLASEPPFDLIFCRNVLIYLHDEARLRVLENLDRMLAPDGLLCMGHAEPLSLLASRFRNTGPTTFFLFERLNSGKVMMRDVPKPFALPRAKRQASRPAPSTGKIAPTNLLLRARAEADAGALDAALRTCQTHLSMAQANAEAYSLLGVIHHARGERNEAVSCFRKALYLDPRHEEALMHLMLLSEEKGDTEAAARLRERLTREGTA